LKIGNLSGWMNFYSNLKADNVVSKRKHRATIRKKQGFLQAKYWRKCYRDLSGNEKLNRPGNELPPRVGRLSFSGVLPVVDIPLDSCRQHDRSLLFNSRPQTNRASRPYVAGSRQPLSLPWHIHCPEEHWRRFISNVQSRYEWKQGWQAGRLRQRVRASDHDDGIHLGSMSGEMAKRSA
jgi:hypothetical protein